MTEHDTPPARTYDLTVTRVLPAPVDAVWRAWSDPGSVRRWWGPTGFTCPVADLDLRVGGTSLVCMRAPAEHGGQDIYNTWTYREIVPGELIAFDLRFVDADGAALDPADLGMPGIPPHVPHLVTLRAVDDAATELTVTERGYASDATRQQSRAGLEQCLDKMAALLAPATA